LRGARPEIWLSDLLIGIVAAGYIVVLPVIMKIRLGILTVVLGGFIFLALSAAGSPTQETVSQQEEDFSWMPIVAGAVDYQKFVVSGPNRVYVARLHRDNPDAFIESSIGQGRLSGGLETVRNMYHRYNEAINYWGPAGRLPSAEPDWGGRNQVVVAINGFFYDFFTGIPQSGQVHSGWFSKYYEVNGEAEGFVWKSNGQAFIGECITQSPSDQKISHLPTNTEILFDGVNRNRKGNELIISTPQ
jgi:hypothetical protein